MKKSEQAATRWVAPLEHPADLATTIYYGLFDNKPYIVLDDKDGNYSASDGESHNIVGEGHALAWKIRREFLLNIEKIRASQYALAGFDPPEPMPRWQPLTRRRDPQKNDASANIRQDPTDSVPQNQIPSQGPQGGTLNGQHYETSDCVQDTIRTTIHQEIMMNVSEAPADSNLPTEFCEAPWCAETLVGLARSRHRPGLFEIKDDDADHEAAEKLLREAAAMGLSPTQAWSVIDQHIMAMMDGDTWWATQRKGKNKRFGLAHVFSQWGAVEESLTKQPWSPLDTVPYAGPALPGDDLPAYGDGYEIKVEAPSPLIIESTLEPEPWPMIAEETENPAETYDIKEPLNCPEVIIEETEEEPVLMPQLRGMTMDEYNALFEIVRQEHPEIISGYRVLSDGSFALAIECGKNRWMPVRSEIEWRTDPLVSRAIRDAVRYGQQTML